MPIRADIAAELAPALRHISGPLLAAAEAWPFGRQAQASRRRMSVCPDSRLLTQDSWRESLRCGLAAPLLGVRSLLERRRKGFDSASHEAGSSGPALHGSESAPAQADDLAAAVPLEVGGHVLDARPTRPWTPQPGSPAARSRRRLLRVVDECLKLIDDIDDPRAADIAVKLRMSTNLPEIWHLRPEVFDLVSRHHTQTEAQRRLALLDTHFPSRHMGL